MGTSSDLGQSNINSDLRQSNIVVLILIVLILSLAKSAIGIIPTARTIVACKGVAKLSDDTTKIKQVNDDLLFAMCEYCQW